MQVGDLVRASKDTSLSAAAGIVAADPGGLTGEWISVLFASEIGKVFAPVDGIFLIHVDHLEVINESR